MGTPQTRITPSDLLRRLATDRWPRIFDVRRREAFDQATDLLPTARWCDHRDRAFWAGLPPGQEILVYCVHGHQVSQSAAALLRAQGLTARYLEGGIEGYRAAGGPLIAKTAFADPVGQRPSRWITRERPKIDRIACPWIIRRFLDPEAEIHYVAADWVAASAVELEAEPFDIPDVALSHVGERCSFDAFLERFGLADPALDRLATIVRGADTGRPDLAPQAAGLLACALGLSAIEEDDLALLEKGLLLYDALYGWCRFAADEAHGWPPAPSEAKSGTKAGAKR